jgi:hypothetical protein
MAMARAERHLHLDARAALRRAAPWLLAASLVSVLRSLPFAALALRADPARPLTSYLPLDWLAYVALIRETPSHGGFALANPFTTAPQDGRLVILFLQALGAVHRVTGLDPFWLLELSRIPLTFAFFAVLWWLLGRVLQVHAQRRVALVLVAFCGGMEFLALDAASLLPPALRATLEVQLSPSAGWSTFAALWNPLWIVGLTLQLWIVGLALDPQRTRSFPEFAAFSAGLCLLWFTHPYSAIATVVILAAGWLLPWACGVSVNGRELARLAVALALAMLPISAVAAWQLQDTVQRAASANTLGTQSTDVFWYPLTLGLPLVFAVRGWSYWQRTSNLWGPRLAAWVTGIALLHSSPVLNGAHFVAYLHLPVCLLAAPALTSLWTLGPRLPGVAVALALFASPLVLTVNAVRVSAAFVLPDGFAEILADLSRLPPGNVLAPSGAGTLIPAYARHRVVAGHPFMTPDFSSRAAFVDTLLAEGSPEQLRAAVLSEQIDYVVAPWDQAARAAVALGAGEPERRRGWALLHVGRRQSAPPR